MRLSYALDIAFSVTPMVGSNLRMPRRRRQPSNRPKICAKLPHNFPRNHTFVCARARIVFSLPSNKKTASLMMVRGRQTACAYWRNLIPRAFWRSIYEEPKIWKRICSIRSTQVSFRFSITVSIRVSVEISTRVCIWVGIIAFVFRQFTYREIVSSRDKQAARFSVYYLTVLRRNISLTPPYYAVFGSA